MSTVLVICAALVGLCLVTAVAFFSGHLEPPAKTPHAMIAISPKKLLLAALAAVLVGLLTGLPIAAIGAACLVYVAPALRLKNPQAQAMAKLEAIADWTESLREAARTGGIEEALRRSASTASPAIATEMGHLVENLDPVVGCPTGTALRKLADDLSDPAADTVIAPLVLAVEQQAKGLVDLLGALSTTARSELAMRGRIEARRAPAYLNVRMVVWFSLGFFALIFLVAHSYMAPFATPGGELVLMVALAFYGAGLALMLRLVRPEPEPRLLVPLENKRPR